MKMVITSKNGRYFRCTIAKRSRSIGYFYQISSNKEVNEKKKKNKHIEIGF